MAGARSAAASPPTAATPLNMRARGLALCWHACMHFPRRQAAARGWGQGAAAPESAARSAAAGRLGPAGCPRRRRGPGAPPRRARPQARTPARRRAALSPQSLAPPWLRSVFDSVSGSLRRRAGAQVLRFARLQGMSARAARAPTPGGGLRCPPGSAPLRRRPAGARARGRGVPGRAPGAGPGGTPGAGPRSRLSACTVL
jgi:hypothetical protein